MITLVVAECGSDIACLSGTSTSIITLHYLSI